MPQIRQTERRLKVIELLRNGMTETDIAPKLEVSRYTIVRDVRWLKQNIAYDFNLITNEILQKLHTRIDKMTDKDLINFLGKLIPQKVEAKTEYIEEKKLDVTILAEYVSALDSALERDIQALRARKQMDTREAQATST